MRNCLFGPTLLLSQSFRAMRSAFGKHNAGGEGFDSLSPRVFFHKSEWLAEAKRRLAAGDAALRPALERLLEDARAELGATPLSVTQKTLTPPSGDKRDYISFGIYWWPNPDTEDGLPWVRRDGEVNPMTQTGETDAVRMKMMGNAVETLGLAYYFSGEEAFAEQAVRLIRTWFMAPDTRMNPNMTYAQGVPGRNDGRPWGLIEGTPLPRVADAAGLLAGSAAWTEGDQHALEGWFRELLEWMLTNENGIAEGKSHNNHGTWYDAQTASYALFTRQPDVAREILGNTSARIAAHIEPDGRQPAELRRTRSFHYSVFNLQAFLVAARLGERVSLDLWGVESKDGRCLRKAIDFLAEQALVKGEWPFEEIEGLAPGKVFPILRMAAVSCGLPRYEALIAAAPDGPFRDARWQLLCPPPEEQVL